MKKLISMILVLSLVFALAACGGKDAASGSNGSAGSAAPEKPVEEIKSADLQAFYDSTFVGENMPMMGVMEKEALDAFYAGLSALNLKQCIVAMPMISAVPAEVALVEVADAADLAKVEEIFKARIAYQIDGGAFYPATVEAWEKSTEIITHGNTMMMICMDPKDEVVKAFNELFA